MYNFPSGNFLKVRLGLLRRRPTGCNEGRALRLGQTWEVVAWEIAFGKLPHGKIPLESYQKMPLEKYLTSSIDNENFFRHFRQPSIWMSVLLCEDIPRNPSNQKLNHQP